MSDCPEILDEIALECSNVGAPREERHEHATLIGGRAKGMERYTPAMIHAILRGLRKHYQNAEAPNDLDYLGCRIDEPKFHHFRSLDTLEVGPTLDEPQRVCESLEPSEASSK